MSKFCYTRITLGMLINHNIFFANDQFCAFLLLTIIMTSNIMISRHFSVTHNNRLTKYQCRPSLHYLMVQRY